MIYHDDNNNSESSDDDEMVVPLGFNIYELADIKVAKINSLLEGTNIQLVEYDDIDLKDMKFKEDIPVNKKVIEFINI
jgi:hypothetical protein